MRARKSFYSLLLIVCALTYVAGFWGEYLLDPLGRLPVLDGDENLTWVARIAHGQLPEEPLYRALLYPWFLSLFRLDGAALVQFATFIGGVFHCLNALLVALLALRMWHDRRAGWLSGLIYLCYPVAMYFSVQVLDMTFAICLFLSALYCAVRASEERDSARCRQWSWNTAAGLLAGLAVLARPNFLLAVLALPFAPFLLNYASGQWRRVMVSTGILSGMVLLPLLAQGVFNYSKAGEFRVLPWQGGYNLFTANKTGANGKYYKQQVAFDEVPLGANPNRLESEYLYQSATGLDFDIDAMNAYWREQLVTDVKADPIRWIGLMGRKVLYLLNDWEQYNNLTYAFHKERFAFLRYNPLGWGLLLISSIACLYLLRSSLNTRLLLLLTALFAMYAGGVLLFYVSARFRLPLVPFLVVFCGGFALLSPSHFKVFPRRVATMLAGIVCLGGVLVYGNWFDAKDEATYIQDELLLAMASSDIEEDTFALYYSQAVLIRDPQRREALVIQATSLYNLWLIEADAELSAQYWQQLGVALRVIVEPDASIYFISGLYAWRSGHTELGIKQWRSGVEAFGEKASSCRNALLLVTNDLSDIEITDQMEQLRLILGN